MTGLFKGISLSYKNAPVDIRENIALGAEESGQVMKHIKDFTEAGEVLVVSTCNRTEVYYSSARTLTRDIIKIIGVVKGYSSEKLSPYFVEFLDSQEAVQHLFHVSIGLESMVLGDIQITGQIKDSYQLSADMDMAGPFLHRLMHTIFFTNKRIVQETSFRDGAASVSYASAELASELVKGIISPKALILGVGEMGADTGRNLVGTNIEQVLVCNRTEIKAELLANEINGKHIPFSQLKEAILEADVVISSIPGDKFKIDTEFLTAIDIPSFKYFIDISVPRSISTEVEGLPGIMRYDIDDIKQKTDETQEKRLESIPKVRQIIQEAIAEFENWSKEMEVSPTIQKLKNALEQIRQEEIDRYVKKIQGSDQKALDTVTKNMMQKILKLPVIQLKAACQRGEAETLIDVLNDLFNLEQEQQQKSK